jgi:hypothetical protein
MSVVTWDDNMTTWRAVIESDGYDWANLSQPNMSGWWNIVNQEMMPL